MSDFPVFQSTMNPLLEVLRESPAPLSIEEIERRVAERMELPAALLAIPHDEGKPDRSEVGYRIAWARTWLKKAGFVDNPKRGEWTVTERGRSAGHIDVDALLAEVARGYRAKAAAQSSASSTAPSGDDDEAHPDDTFEAETEIDASEDEASAARVGPVLEADLRSIYEKLGNDGALPTRQEIAGMLARFRERFAPGVLAGLDGLPLLTRLHARGTKESLVHWLEFKDDDELTTSRFGSIAGGSALKFGIYQSIETGAWMTGPPQHQVPDDNYISPTTTTASPHP